MTGRRGKYLVFCANAGHMREMMSYVPEWVGKIDARPHVYSAYSDDLVAAKAFRDFKADSIGTVSGCAGGAAWTRLGNGIIRPQETTAKSTAT